MITSTAGINLGRAPEFSKTNDHGVVQLAAFIEVTDQRCQALVPFGHEGSLEGLENIRVMIPSAVIHRDE